MALSIDRDDEELMRHAENLVNELWGLWTTKTYASESHLAVMSRVAFQFAVLYLRGERNARQIEQLDAHLSELLKNVPGLD